MNPQLALVLTIGFVAVLFAYESVRSPATSPALWIPVLWIGITGSRFVSQWLSVFGIDTGGGDLAEGSPIDAAWFLVLILAGLAVLYQRRLQLAVLVRANPWVVAFFVFGLVSILWSDFAFIAFKRWIKTLGHPVMALIVVSDRDPARALRTVLKRCAFLLLPFSVLLIKYYPQYGRGFDPFTGQGYNNGVALNKNDLGYVCMILGVFLVWDLLLPQDSRRSRLTDRAVDLVLLAIVALLFRMVNSATALVTFAIGTVTILTARVVDRRRVGACLLVGFACLALAEWMFGISDELLALLGRNPSLTDRTAVWGDVLALQNDPLLGVGFESFWLGERLEVLWQRWWWHPIQAHNGYLETYLNLGVAGLFLLLGMLVAAYRKANRALAGGSRLAVLRLAFLFAVLAYNFTEAGFKGVHLVWTVFTIMAMEYPMVKARHAAAAPSALRTRSRARGFAGTA